MLRLDFEIEYCKHLHIPMVESFNCPVEKDVKIFFSLFLWSTIRSWLAVCGLFLEKYNWCFFSFISDFYKPCRESILSGSEVNFSTKVLFLHHGNCFQEVFSLFFFLFFFWIFVETVFYGARSVSEMIHL